MNQSDIEAGDIVIFEVDKTFPMERTARHRGVVESVSGNEVDLGIDGVVSLDRIVKRVGKSPSVTGSEG